jgi:hypothetical protein
MRWRDFITLLGGTAATWPGVPIRFFSASRWGVANDTRQGRNRMPLMPRLIIGLLVLAALSSSAVAQYPNKPITVIVPSPPADRPM